MIIKEIVTHGSPAHLDELTGIYLLQELGEKQLPGVSTASIRCITSEDNVAALAARKDVVLIGLGSGSFDEHVFNGDKSKKDECAATLVAKFLGIDQSPLWRRILKSVLHTDKHVPTNTLDLATTVMRLQTKKQAWSLQETVQYAKTSIEAARQAQEEFFRVPLQAIKEQKTLKINGEEHWMAVAEGDHPQLPAAARFFGAAVVILKNPNGQVQILTRSDLRLDMRDTVGILRVFELKARGVKARELPPWKRLHEEGAIEEVPEWFLHQDAHNILNGGRSRPDISPTKLSLATVVSAVEIGLQINWFQPQRTEKCTQGVCTSTPQNPCSWYQLGLFRCSAVRRQMHRK